MDSPSLPLISVILPVYNEEALLREHVIKVVMHLRSLQDQLRAEVLLVNDGSTDGSADIADQLVLEYPEVNVIHHPCNFGLGQALKFGFANTKGDYVVTLDVDLSYDVHHIEELLEVLKESHAKIVLASPYMPGGSISNVPLLRKTLSILGNKFLRQFAHGSFSTLTSMVRVYDGPFIRALDLRAMSMDIMPEMLYKSMVVRAKIVEAPGRLDWGPQLRFQQQRLSSMKILRHVYSTITSGFIFRPMLFFIVPGVLVGVFAAYVNFWMFAHFFNCVGEIKAATGSLEYEKAFAMAYERYPHTFVTALLSAMLTIQLLGLGIITAQNKRYFEELFHLGSTDLQDLNIKMKADD